MEEKLTKDSGAKLFSAALCVTNSKSRDSTCLSSYCELKDRPVPTNCDLDIENMKMQSDHMHMETPSILVTGVLEKETDCNTLISSRSDFEKQALKPIVSKSDKRSILVDAESLVSTISDKSCISAVHSLNTIVNTNKCIVFERQSSSKDSIYSEVMAIPVQLSSAAEKVINPFASVIKCSESVENKSVVDMSPDVVCSSKSLSNRGVDTDSVLPIAAEMYMNSPSCDVKTVVKDVVNIATGNERSILPTTCKQENATNNEGTGNKEKKKQIASENMIRMNYLYQASRFIASQETSATENYSNHSSMLGSLCSSIGRKGVVRVCSQLKRQFCKGCGTALIPGINSKCRLRNNRQKHLVVTCNTCRTIKRFVTDPNYSLWSDKPEASG